MKDLNPRPRLKDPNRVTKRMVTRACVNAGIHAPVRIRDPFHKGPGVKWSVGWETTHDITTNLNRALGEARAAKMHLHLVGPQAGLSRRQEGPRAWACLIPPCRGRVWREFRARTAAKAVCAAIIDHIEHPQED